MGSNHNEFDQWMRERAKTEDCPVPVNFETHLGSRLADLPERGRRGRNLGRRVLVFAAVICVLTACAGAAGLILGQGTIYLFHTENAAWTAAEAAGRGGESSVVRGINTINGKAVDYREPRAFDLKRLQEEYRADGEILEHALGGAGDGWTEMLTARSEDVQVTVYQADSLLGLSFLWPGELPGLSWLEERYTAVPGCEGYIEEINPGTGETETIFFTGEYQGEGEAAFCLTWMYHPTYQVDDIYLVTEGMDAVEEYRTKDGVTVTIETATSATGKSMFWVEFGYGYAEFDIYGTQMELTELKEIVDRLNLSALCAYEVQ